MTDFYLWPGLLGTRATFGPDIALVLVLISALLFTIGWRLAVHKHIGIHRWVQTSAATLNAAAVLSIMVGSFWGFVLPIIPATIHQPVTLITTVHAAIGAITFLLGVYVVLSANKLMPRAWRFSNYKPFMRISYALYMVSTLVGVVVYLVTYVLAK